MTSKGTILIDILNYYTYYRPRGLVPLQSSSSLVMIEALFQSEYEKHEGQCDDECYRLSPLEHDLGGRHREMFDLRSLSQGDIW